MRLAEKDIRSHLEPDMSEDGAQILSKLWYKMACLKRLERTARL
ncbi:hypothetical protein ES702_03612 [subsurface metagenome]